jgi:hypothetical protein
MSNESPSPLSPSALHSDPPPPPLSAAPAPAPVVVPPFTNVLAILSLVFGLSSWVFLPLLGAITAVICGHLARSEIRRSPVKQEGDGLAIGGMILGYVQLAVGAMILFVVLAFAFGLAWASHDQ